MDAILTGLPDFACSRRPVGDAALCETTSSLGLVRFAQRSGYSSLSSKDKPVIH